MKVYVPNLNDYKCVYVRDTNTVRAYKQNPKANTTVEYVDYYINSNYIYTEGTQSFGNYPNLPHCLSADNLTNDFYYRNDFDSILIIFVIIVIFSIWLPFKIFSRFCKRLWR